MKNRIVSCRVVVLLTLIVFSGFTLHAQTPITGSWFGQDIGSPALAGSASFSNNTFTINGAGADIWGTADQFHFVYQTLSNTNCEIIAKVNSIDNTNAWAKAGIMIRDTASNSSAHAMIVVSAANGVSFQRRLTSGGSSTSTTVTGIAVPKWIRLLRTANSITSYHSSDGTTWTEVGVESVAMTGSIYVGMVVTSHNTAALCTATFDNVSLTGNTIQLPAAPSDLTASLISSSQIDLSWTDNSSDEDSFIIQRTLNGSLWTTIATINADLTSYSNTGLSGLTDYSYRVYAYKTNGASSNYSNTASVTTPGYSSITPPSNLSATAIAANRISLTWTDNSDEDYFIIQRSDDGGITWPYSKTAPANATSFISGGVRSTSTYYYRVNAVKGTDKSSYSATANATTMAIPPMSINTDKVSTLAGKIIFKTSNPNVSSIVSSANGLLYGYTDEEWLAIVPVQAPRDYPKSPITNTDSWTWNSRKPNEITDDGGNVFYYYSPTSYTPVKVLSGKTVNVPLWNGRLLGAQIDWQKTYWLRTRLQTLASAFEVTGDEKYAHRVAITLDSLAKCVPDHFMTTKNGSTLLTPEQATAMNADVQRSSDHNGVAHELNESGVIAYDRVKSCDTMAVLSLQKNYSVKDNIETNYLKNIVYYLKDFVPISIHLSTNIPFAMEGAMMTATTLNLPDVAEWIYEYADSSITRNIMRDGICPESFGYGMNYLINNTTTINELQRYCNLYPDQPEIQSFKNQVKRLSDFYAWTKEQAVKACYPDGYLPPFDNTSYVKYSAGVRTTTKTAVLPSYGHVMLGDGTGTNQVQYNIHFPGSANHVQGTGHGVALYAFGAELTGNIRYYRHPGRNWAQSTLAQNTVVVNVTDQYYDNDTPVDRAYTYFTNGTLALIESNNNGISVSESDVRNRYVKLGVSRYQRLSALNAIDPLHPYILDLFKVKGGNKHDYVMHGSTSFDQTATASFPLTLMTGSRPLLNTSWTEPTSEGSQTDWYGIFRNVSQGKSPGYWDVSIKDKNTNTKGYRLLMTDEGKNNVFVGESPAPTRLAEVSADLYKYWRPGIIARHADNTTTQLETLFAGVIEPLNGPSHIDSIRRISLQTEHPEHIALAVYLKNGRRDVWLVNMNNPKLTSNNNASVLVTKDSSFSLNGRIGFFSNTGKNLLIAGNNMRYKEHIVSLGTDAYRGKITGLSRIANGDSTNAFITDANLPEGEVLKDKWMALYFGLYNNVPGSSGTYRFGVTQQKGMNQMYLIKNVEKKNGKTYVNLYDDHSLRMTNGDLEEIMRQHKKFTGANDFIIYQSKFDNTQLTLEFNNGKDADPDPVDNVTGAETPEDNTIQIYSRQKTVVISIEGQPARNATAVVYDVLGRGMMVRELEESFTTLETGYKPGIYIVKVITGSKTKTQRVILK